MYEYATGLRVTRSADRSERVLSVEVIDEDGHSVIKLPTTAIGSYQAVGEPRKVTLEFHGFRVEEVTAE